MNIYDEVPYPVLSHSQTHPAALATLAILHGMRPAPVTRCRVLELGCAGGGNLIPMAYSLPESGFVGIDYSARQIEEGQGLVDRLGLKNIQLSTLNLLDADDSLGRFDYIIAHGLYSWVPPNVREKLLEVCKRCLLPNGVAYVSYNTYPGWKMLSAVRDILLYHTRDVEDPMQKAAEARSLLDFLVEFLSSAKSVSNSVTYAHAEYLKSVMQKFEHGQDSYLVHDILEEINDPVYFREFIAQAERYGLQYVCDSDFRPALAANLSASLAQKLTQWAKDRIEWEQYTDFISNRMFRQTLLCHDGVPLSTSINADTIRAFRFASGAHRLEEEAQPEGAARFGGFDGAKLTIDHPLSQAALNYLIQLWPKSATFDELLTQARARLYGTTDDDEKAALDAQALATTLLRSFSYSARLVEITVHTPDFVTEVSERPVASEWARLQATLNYASVTNLRHERVHMDDFQSFLLPRLDGANDRLALIEQLMNGPVAGGDLTMKLEDGPVSDPARVRELLGETVDGNLRELARMAVLIA